MRTGLPILLDLFLVVIAFYPVRADLPARSLRRSRLDRFCGVTIRQGFDVLLAWCGQLLHVLCCCRGISGSNGVFDGVGNVGQLDLGGFRVQLVYIGILEVTNVSVVGQVVCKADSTFDVGVRLFFGA